MTLAWGPSADPAVVGYDLHYGGASRTYTNMVAAGDATNGTVSGLLPGAKYFFAATAVDSAGLASVFSNEISYQVPASTNPPAIALTSPLNGASYTAPATIALAASVTTNGNSITGVQYYNGTTLLGTNATAPYSLSWSGVSAGSYSLTAEALYDAGSTVASSPVNINVVGLPAPWQTANIGSVGVAGSASMSNGVFTVNGAGNLSGLADNFRFVYQPLSGNGEITARLDSVESTGTGALIGVMIRESLTSGSEYVCVGVLPNGTFRWQGRIATSGSTWAANTSTVGTPPNVWTRLVRTGNVFYDYLSTNGTAWTEVHSCTNAMATQLYIGLAVASGNSTTLNTARFSDVTVVP